MEFQIEHITPVAEIFEPGQELHVGVGKLPVELEDTVIAFRFINEDEATFIYPMFQHQLSTSAISVIRKIGQSSFAGSSSPAVRETDDIVALYSTESDRFKEAVVSFNLQEQRIVKHILETVVFND